MVSVADVKASNARITVDSVPRVSVLCGATDGIGKAFLTRLVATKLKIRVYVLGRNGDKHKPFLDELRRGNANADLIWIECQLSQGSCIRKACDEIQRLETSIDLLYMSAGFINAGSAKSKTDEQQKLSIMLSYYGRLLLAILLQPLLNASTNSPRVISVLACGNETADIFLDDLDMLKPEHASLTQRSHSLSTYTTISFGRLARENPRVLYFHHYPGGVNTGVFKKSFGTAWYWPLLSLALCMATSPADAGEKVLYMGSSAKYSGVSSKEGTKGGVPLASGQSAGLNMNKTRGGGALFLVNDKMKELYQEKVMADLEKRNAPAIVWEKAMDTLKPYL
ncbi:short-chain dehydrogenase [Sporothrix schenckii 1099-18]|uniref:Short-chain dehydrogenase n=1 Tax=Sporothrix schenckii 1099-18 TaxID=1397361 RepID=A0A0F2LU41_SPOSC|nr:short-chain dehydrogenase [Sporothrix schenckii 1099-18]KJR80972.1 short-chain dehydrogenase [Sporothrix schenckii 1099-18]